MSLTEAADPIPRVTRDDPAAGSGDVVPENIAALKALFPSIVTDGRIDFEVLRQLIGDDVEEGEERYGLNWKGKRRARAFALTPTLGTLRPSKGESQAWDSTKNIVVEGDNLEVLKCLRRSYAGQVKLIYIDPPYNTATDMLYPNDYHDSLSSYLEITGQKDGAATLVSNPKTGGRYHTNWLNLMYPRLILARELLRDDGVLICTIDENEQANLSVLLADVFPEGGFDHVCVTIVHNPRGVQGTNFSYTHEYALFVYRKGGKRICNRRIADEDVDWSQFRNWGTESERTDARNCFYPVMVENGEVVGFGDVCPDDFHPSSQTTADGNRSLVYPIDRSGVERKWRYARQSTDQVAGMLKAKPTDNGYEILLGKTFGQQRTVWVDQRFDANIYGTQLVSELVPGSPFTFPKSLWAVYDCVAAVTGDDPDALILDFFAGSGTTGHAVMQLNADDGGRRRFILAQLPVPIESDTYKTIADVTKLRVRNAGLKIAADHANQSLDTGFRVYKLASSNLRPWAPDPDNLTQSLLDAVDNILPNRSEDDLLVELLLKTGIDLTLPMETRTICQRLVHALGGGVLIVYLGDVPDADAEGLGQGIADWHAELDPVRATTFYFRDSGFATAAAKANVAAIIRPSVGNRVERLASI